MPLGGQGCFVLKQVAGAGPPAASLLLPCLLHFLPLPWLLSEGCLGQTRGLPCGWLPGAHPQEASQPCPRRFGGLRCGRGKELVRACSWKAAGPVLFLRTRGPLQLCVPREAWGPEKQQLTLTEHAHAGPCAKPGEAELSPACPWTGRGVG